MSWEQQPTIKRSTAHQVKTVSSEAAVSAVLCDPALHISVFPSFRYLALFDTHLSTASSLYLVVIDPPSPRHPSVWLENGRQKKKKKKTRRPRSIVSHCGPLLSRSTVSSPPSCYSVLGGQNKTRKCNNHCLVTVFSAMFLERYEYFLTCYNKRL